MSIAIIYFIYIQLLQTGETTTPSPLSSILPLILGQSQDHWHTCECSTANSIKRARNEIVMPSSAYAEDNLKNYRNFTFVAISFKRDSVSHAIFLEEESNDYN